MFTKKLPSDSKDAAESQTYLRRRKWGKEGKMVNRGDKLARLLFIFQMFGNFITWRMGEKRKIPT